MSRNILAPPIISLGSNRNYRVNLIHDLVKLQESEATGHPNSNIIYQESDLYSEDYDEIDGDNETTSDTYNIEEISNSMFQLVMHVAPSFYGGLIGKKGVTKKRIANETQTKIIIPSHTANENSEAMVCVQGSTRSSVIAARHKINLLVASLRCRMRPTHFYGVALNYGEIRENFNTLREQILSAKLPGIDDSLFIDDSWIHLTFGTCTLMDNTERKKASSILESCRQFLSDLRAPFRIKVNGLEIMNDDPSAAKVLYGTVQAPELQIFANRCFKLFKSSPLSNNNISGDDVKLHMTIMNNRYRRNSHSLNTNDNGNNNEDNAKCLPSFDVREILKRWRDYDFGSIECNELLLCVIHETNGISTNEFYKISNSLKFQ